MKRKVATWGLLDEIKIVAEIVGNIILEFSPLWAIIGFIVMANLG